MFDYKVLNYAVGFPNELGWSSYNVRKRTSYLADMSIITGYKLVQEWSHPKETKYIITIHGIEVLNQLRNSRYSKDLLISSKRLEILTIILIIFTAILIATKPLYVSLDVLVIVIFIFILYFIFMKVYRMKK